MAIGANSYGTVAEVEALTPLYADGAGGVYDGGTKPTLTQVESFIDQVSGIVNVILAKAGFAIPVSQADAKQALDLFVNQEAAHYCEYANGAGPFIPQSDEMRGVSPTRIILKDAEMFISANAAGLARLGATRTYDATYGLDCRTTDDEGDTIVPIFQRKQFGNEITDWDVG